MVLERVFPEDWLERKPWYAFILGASYAAVGISGAWLLFRRDPALVAVAFISILLLPALRKIFAIEERQERREKRFSWRGLIKDDYDVILTYLALFLGVFIVYALATLWMPSLQVNSLFQQQLEHRCGSMVRDLGTGMAMSGSLTWHLLSNNLYVLIAIFIVGLLAGDGASFLVVWNASVWGTVFGALARDASIALGTGSLTLLVIVLLIVLPHMLLEALAYIMAAISGSVTSKNIERGRHSAGFHRVLKFNAALLLAAILVLLVGVAVESWVLQNVEYYRTLHLASCW